LHGPGPFIRLLTPSCTISVEVRALY
jgi:hypothetical protein